MTVNPIQKPYAGPVKRALSMLQVAALLLAHALALASPSPMTSGPKLPSSAVAAAEHTPAPGTFDPGSQSVPRVATGGGMAPDSAGVPARPSATGKDSKVELAQLEVEKAASEARLAVMQLHHQEQLTEVRSQIDTLHAETELSATQRESRGEQLKTAMAALES